MFDLGLAVFACGLGVTLCVLRWPRPPVLDGSRWLNMVLATLLRGEEEAKDGTEEAWVASVRATVLYHPAGRLIEQKLLNPTTASMPSGALEGERELLTQLKATDDVKERFHLVFSDNEASMNARLSDPYDLGQAYDPSALCASSWDQIAAWAAGDGSCATDLAKRMREQTVVVGDGAVVALIAQELTEAGQVVQRVPADVDALMAMADAVPAGTWLMWFVQGEDALALLASLTESLAMRDCTAAVCALGAPVGGRTDVDPSDPRSVRTRRDWMGTWFRHLTLEPELVRLVPYLSAQWIDPSCYPPGVDGIPVQNARFPEPGEEGMTVRTIESVDLGVVSVDVNPRHLARALWWVTAGWVARRA